MAKCRLCKANIRDGLEYCEDCQGKEKVTSNETYLDSLLNSVKNAGPSLENVYKKKSDVKNILPPSEDMVSESDFVDNSEKHVNKDEYDIIMKNGSTPDETDGDNIDDTYQLDISDLEDFDKYDFKDDLDDLSDDLVISDEDLFGEDISHLFPYQEDDTPLNSSKEEILLPNQYEVGETLEEDLNHENIVLENISHEKELAHENITPETELTQETVALGKELSEENTEQYETTATSDYENRSYEDADQLTAASLTIELDPTDEDTVKSADIIESNIKPEDISELSEDDSFDLDLDQLLNSIDSPTLPTNEEGEINEQDQDFDRIDKIEELKGATSNIEKEDIPEFEAAEAEDDDILSLLNQISFDDPVKEDVEAINELLRDSSTLKTQQSNAPSDVGEVFSDALKAVSSLKDYELDEDEVLSGLSDREEEKKDSSKNKKALKKEKNKKEKHKEEKDTEEKSDVSLWKRLFGNIKNEKTAAKHEEELKAKSEAAKLPKKAKSKGKNKKDSEEEIEKEESLKSKKAAKKKTDDKKAAKKEKAAKKKQSKEVIQVIDEIDEDPGRINRLGAVIVFTFFGILAAVLILGTKIVSYSLSIEHATTYFGNKKYTQAYNEVYGVDIKDEDIVIYDKIMTVMYVNKQLDSYNSYYGMQMYPEALDSLLKGLSRYDKYIELATMLGVASDLKYVREKLLAELNNVYHLSEKEAINIINSQNRKEYSLAVYDVVKEKMNY